MNTITKSLATFGIIATLGACATPPEPQVIYAEPTYDKFGNAECSNSGRTDPGSSTSSQLPPCVPEGCEETSTAGTTAVPCIPTTPPQTGTLGGDPQTPGRNPTGGTVP